MFYPYAVNGFADFNDWHFYSSLYKFIINLTVPNRFRLSNLRRRRNHYIKIPPKYQTLILFYPLAKTARNLRNISKSIEIIAEIWYHIKNFIYSPDKIYRRALNLRGKLFNV